MSWLDEPVRWFDVFMILLVLATPVALLLLAKREHRRRREDWRKFVALERWRLDNGIRPVLLTRSEIEENERRLRGQRR